MAKPTMHDRRSVRLSGTQRVRKVRRDREETVTGFARRMDSLSRVTGGIGAVKRSKSPTVRETESAGAPKVIDRGARGERLRMGWRDSSAAIEAAAEGVILDGDNAGRVDNLDCFLSWE